MSNADPNNFHLPKGPPFRIGPLLDVCCNRKRQCGIFEIFFAKHYKLDTEQFGHLAHATPLTNPPPGPTTMLVTGPGHPVIKVGAIVKGVRTRSSKISERLFRGSVLGTKCGAKQAVRG
jgi:hypothetical protein